MLFPSVAYLFPVGLTSIMEESGYVMQLYKTGLYDEKTQQRDHTTYAGKEKYMKAYNYN